MTNHGRLSNDRLCDGFHGNIADNRRRFIDPNQINLSQLKRCLLHQFSQRLINPVDIFLGPLDTCCIRNG